VAVSRDLAAMLREAAAGLTDMDVVERTGLSYATWRAMVEGRVMSDAKIVQFAAGLNIDPKPLLDVAARVRPSMDPAQIVVHGLQLSGLSAGNRVKVMEFYRELRLREAESRQSAEQAA
jgi:hypothetical protein